MFSLEKYTDASIWEALVRYANTDFTSKSESVNGPKAFRELVTRSLRKIDEFVDIADICEELPEENSFSSLAEMYQPDIRHVLKWLCDPVGQRKSATSRVKFLQFHGMDGLRIEWSANDAFDPKFRIWKNVSECGSVIAPVCRFILEQIDAYDELDDEHKKLSYLDRLGVCQRSGCTKFFVARKAGRNFCSALCRASDYQSKMTPKEKADRMQRYRSLRKRRRLARTVSH